MSPVLHPRSPNDARNCPICLNTVSNNLEHSFHCQDDDVKEEDDIDNVEKEDDIDDDDVERKDEESALDMAMVR